jgi:hypothetical protein
VETTPSRVQFFTWLLVQDKTQSRHNLQRKHAIDRAECELCHHDDETADHIMFSCPTTATFWARLGVPPAAVPSASVLELWNMPCRPCSHSDTALSSSCSVAGTSGNTGTLLFSMLSALAFVGC